MGKRTDRAPSGSHGLISHGMCPGFGLKSLGRVSNCLVECLFLGEGVGEGVGGHI